MKLTKISALVAIALAPAALMAAEDSMSVKPAVPVINPAHEFNFAGFAIQFKYVHGTNEEKPFVGAIDLAGDYEQWQKQYTGGHNAFFQLKTGANERQNGVDLTYVINDDIQRLEGLSGEMNLTHDSYVLDQRALCRISGWVADGAQVGSADHRVDFKLYRAAILKDHLGNPEHPEETEKYKQLQNQHALTFTDEGTTVYGDVINLHYCYNTPSYVDGKLNNKTDVRVTDGAVWYGSLLTQTYDENGKRVEASADTETIETNVNTVQNTVLLSNGACWIGATRNHGKNAKTDVLINDSSWTVTENSQVTTLATATKAEITLKDGVVLEAGSLSPGLPVPLADAAAAEERGSTVRFEGLNGTGLNVGSAVAAGTVTGIVAGAAMNNGTLSAQEMAEGMYNAIRFGTSAGEEGTKLEGDTAFAIEQSGFGDGYVGTVSGEGATVTGTVVNANSQRVSDATAVTMMQWRAEATDLMERMGELRGQSAGNGVWARVTGGRSEYNGIDNDYTTFQFGYDHKLALAEDVWVGGAFSYTNGDTDHEVGSGDNRVLAFTGCATWLRDNGAYLDVALRYGTLRNSFDLVSAKGTFNTQALSAAVEAGHRFELPANTFVEPALGLTYSHIFGEDYVSNAAEGAVAIEQDGIDSAVARAGFRAGFACPNNMGGVYLRAWADFKHITGGEIDTPFRVSVGMRYSV